MLMQAVARLQQGAVLCLPGFDFDMPPCCIGGAVGQSDRFGRIIRSFGSALLLDGTWALGSKRDVMPWHDSPEELNLRRESWFFAVIATPAPADRSMRCARGRIWATLSVRQERGLKA